MRRFFIIAMTIIAGNFLTGCGQYKAMSTATDSLNSDTSSDGIATKAKQLINSRCNSCHSPADPQGGVGFIIDLKSMFAAGLIVPGDPVNSYINQVIATDYMPEGQPLNIEEKELVQSWIQQILAQNIDVEVPFANTQSLVINRCSGCHSSAGGSAGGINLENHSQISNLINPGDPYGSPLFDSVLASRMPPDQPLSTRELAMIYNWIYTGASSSLD